MERYLITGGAGFLGYHLVERLLEEGHFVTVLDIDDIPEKDVAARVRFVKGDVRRAEDAQRSLEGVTRVIHAAGALPLWRPEDIFSVNVHGTRVLLQEMRRKGLGSMVFISTTAVYGAPEKHPIYETDPVVPLGPYAESKIKAEAICEEFRRQGMHIPIIRPKTFIGKGRLGIFQILLDWVESGKKIPIIGRGQNYYQLLAVEDFVDMILFVDRHEGEEANTIFNVGAKRYGTVMEDLGALCAHAGSGARVLATPAPLVKAALWVFETLRISPIYYWVYMTADQDSFVSLEKIERLGWSPKYSNAETLIDTYDWYRANAKNIKKESGVNHRSPWDQKVLSLIKKVM